MPEILKVTDLIKIVAVTTQPTFLGESSFVTGVATVAPLDADIVVKCDDMDNPLINYALLINFALEEFLSQGIDYAYYEGSSNGLRFCIIRTSVFADAPGYVLNQKGLNEASIIDLTNPKLSLPQNSKLKDIVIGGAK